MRINASGSLNGDGSGGIDRTRITFARNIKLRGSLFDVLFSQTSPLSDSISFDQ